MSIQERIERDKRDIQHYKDNYKEPDKVYYKVVPWEATSEILERCKHYSHLSFTDEAKAIEHAQELAYSYRYTFIVVKHERLYQVNLPPVELQAPIVTKL